MLIDTHAHLNLKQFRPDLDEVIARAKNTRVNLIINIGSSLETSQQVVRMESDQLKMYSTIGIHPHYAPHSHPEQSITQKMILLEKLYRKHQVKVVGIGESGLDYFKKSSPITENIKQSQKQLFQAQIDLARRLNLPLVIHCRDAWEEIFDFNYQGVKGTFHSFTSDLKNAKKVLDLGFYLSFSCIVTYPKNQHLREIIGEIPVDKILTETDCPFLPPQTIRGQRNEPANVMEVVKVISEVRGISPEEAASITVKNAQTLWKLNFT